MLIFKKINNFNMLHKFQEKTWNSSIIKKCEAKITLLNWLKNREYENFKKIFDEIYRSSDLKKKLKIVNK